MELLRLQERCISSIIDHLDCLEWATGTQIPGAVNDKNPRYFAIVASCSCSRIMKRSLAFHSDGLGNYYVPSWTMAYLERCQLVIAAKQKPWKEAFSDTARAQEEACQCQGCKSTGSWERMQSFSEYLQNQAEAILESEVCRREHRAFI